MKKIEKNKTQELLETMIDLVERASKCHLLGLIADYRGLVEVDNQDAYTVKVVINEYRDNEMRWCDTTSTYEQAESERRKSSTFDAETIARHLQELLDQKKAQLLEQLEIVEG